MVDLGIDELDAELVALDLLLVAPRQPLPEATAPAHPGIYAVWTVGVPPYEHPGFRQGSAVAYVGSAIELRERVGRHRSNARGVADLDDGRRLHIAVVPLRSYAIALFCEEALIQLLRPLWNQPWLKGYGSRWQGSSRVTQRTPPWAVLHRGRRVSTGATTVSASYLRRRAEDHLEQTAIPLSEPIIGPSGGGSGDECPRPQAMTAADEMGADSGVLDQPMSTARDLQPQGPRRHRSTGRLQVSNIGIGAAR